MVKLTPNDKALLLLKLVSTYNRKPNHKEIFEGFKAHVFWDSIKQGKNNDIYENILKHNPILREDYEKTKSKLKIEDKAKILLELVNLQKRLPKWKENYMGVNIYRFWSEIKQGANRKVYEEILSKNSILKFDYEKKNQLGTPKKSLVDLDKELDELEDFVKSKSGK